MARALALAGTLVLLSLSLSSPALAAKDVDPMVDELNRARAQHGLPGLRHSPSLSRSSNRYASHLMANDWFGHASSIRASQRFDRLGEVLAMHRGRGARRRHTVRRWLDSPSHRAVLLDRALRWVGVGKAVGGFEGRRSTIWVAQFGTL